MRTKTTVKRTKSTTKSTLKAIVTNYLEVNRDATDAKVYLHVLKLNGVSVNSMPISSFFSKYSSFPSFRSVSETARISRLSMRPRTSRGTILPARKKVA